ncbi:hypothetical protein AAG906_000875 [Vitis piasezkii]
MNRHPVPSLDACLSELWCEEQRISRIRVEICELSSALVVKILVTLLGIVPRRSRGTAYHASTVASSSTALLVASSVVPIPVPTTLANPNTLTPEMDQVSEKMIAKGPKVG